MKPFCVKASAASGFIEDVPASVPPSRYKALSNSEDPFVCVSCTNVQLMKEIALLKNELRGIAEIRDRYATLSNEVSSLKQALDALRKEPTSSLTTKPTAASKQSKRSYAKAISTLRPAQSITLSKSVATNSVPTPAADHEAQKAQRAREPRTGPKMKVDGARRIWNTMPTCSARAVATTIAKLIPAKLDLQVKRKTKRLAGKTIRWFVVHGSEDDLILLERDWERVQQQTLWSLQNCFMSLNITDGHDDHGMHTPAPTLPQESSLPSAGSPSPSPAPQDHVSSTPSPTLLDPQVLSKSSSPELTHPSKPSTPTNLANGEKPFLDNHQDPLT